MPNDQLNFETAFTALTGFSPFPWQRALYDRFIAGDIPQSCNLSTGLGKTNVLAIWLIALATRPEKMPRRLVYVVNRRTVVDQTTTEAEKLKTNASKAGVPELVISTLRGQFADNREWSADPSRPAVICGTVDMIGSRLLFSGYGVGRNSKPLHAGFLGQDVLLVHDEAHLEPAFQELIEAIAREQKRCNEFGRFRVMELTATRRGVGDVFELTPQEMAVPDVLPQTVSEPKHTVWKRMKSRKGLKFGRTKRADVAKRIGEIARDKWKESGKAILIFVRTIKDVETVHATLTDKKSGGVKPDQIQVLTGIQRGLERDRMANPRLETGCPIFARFLAKPRTDAPESEQWQTVPKDGDVFLICTSAGEVGVDISADHMVCDLTTLDSMAQRFGRVNRRGDGQAEIDLVFEVDSDSKSKDDPFEMARWRTKAILDQLPPCVWPDASDKAEGRQEASPLALGNLNLTEEGRKAAFAPTPRLLPTSDILFDAWALTTIKEKLPGRPPVEPYLHGVAEWQPPETHVAWREEVAVVTGDLLEEYPPANLLDDYPLKPHELLKDNSSRVFERLKKLKAKPETPVWIVSDGDTVVVSTLGKIQAGVKEDMYYVTLLLPPDAGGLTEQGLFDPASDRATDVADEWYADKERKVKRRERKWGEDVETPLGMRRSRPIIDIKPDADENEGSAPSKRFWHWFELAKAIGEGKATASKPYELQRHLDDAKAAAIAIVDPLKLPEPLRSAIIVAAMYHDLGKNRKLWQRSIGNLDLSNPLAKSGGKMRPRELNKYRHEFGSVRDVQTQREFQDLGDEMKELVLHLIAAHHGRARPHFPLDEAIEPEPKQGDVADLASETPRRFAKLQRKYGRWGLAYLESLVRAADIAASQKAENGGGA